MSVTSQVWSQHMIWMAYKELGQENSQQGNGAETMRFEWKEDCAWNIVRKVESNLGQREGEKSPSWWCWETVDNQSLCSLNLNYIYKDCGLLYIYKDCGLIHRSSGDISFQKKELSCLLLMMDSWENAQEAGHDVFFIRSQVHLYDKWRQFPDGQDPEILFPFCLLCPIGVPSTEASEADLVVNNSPANAGSCKKCGFNPWVGKIPWSMAWQPTPVFLPGETHGQKSLVSFRT